MERRVEARQASQETALVKKLNGSEEAMEAGVADISARGLKLLLPVKLEVNTPVSVRLGERILLGDVCYCRQEGGGAWTAGVALTHSISDVEAIRNLMKRLLEAEEDGARLRSRVT
ncbi:MAG: PilZ domain-containing protein [Bryobacterales bacterium]|nr:PilZ domain-containing protein [Bryobacterales bacterium]